MLTPALLALDSHRAFADRLPSLAQEAQRKAMANLPATAYTTPTASPASQRSMRSAGTAGKPSPESAAEMGAPPTPKRRQPSSRQPPARGDPPSRGAKQQAATGAQPPPSNSSMPPPLPKEIEEAPPHGSRHGEIGRLGGKLCQLQLHQREVIAPELEHEHATRSLQPLRLRAALPLQRHLELMLFDARSAIRGAALGHAVRGRQAAPAGLGGPP